MTSTKWRVVFAPGGMSHVIPIDDLRPHEEAVTCWCHPTDDEGVTVHHSLDQRESYEQGRQQA
jgi:hypothetical protein